MHKPINKEFRLLILVSLVLFGAGLLGCIDNSTKAAEEPTVLVPTVTSCISSTQAASNIGKTLTICGPVAEASYRSDVRGRPTFINFDKAYPNHTFTALIWGENRGKFSTSPEQTFGAGKR